MLLLKLLFFFLLYSTSLSQYDNKMSDDVSSRISKLEERYEKKIAQMEKDNEDRDKKIVQMEEDIEDRDKKIVQMEEDIEYRDKKIIQTEEDIEDRVAKLEQLARIGTLRSCAEYSSYGLKSSGMYNIDPDGPLLGREPFQVYCNFETGATEVLHDSENLTVVDHCHEPGKSSKCCYILITSISE